MWMEEKQRAPRNRTLSLTGEEVTSARLRLLHLSEPASLPSILDRTICQDVLEAARWLPDQFVDLLVLDPPYNLTTTFSQTDFKKLPLPDYAAWLDKWFTALRRTLKPTASVYICSEWSSSSAVFAVA